MVLMFLLTVNDTLDDILGESGDEEESDAVVSQVLDEIGIEITGKVHVKLSPIITIHYIWKDFAVIYFPVHVFHFKIIRHKTCRIYISNCVLYKTLYLQILLLQTIKLSD